MTSYIEPLTLATVKRRLESQSTMTQNLIDFNANTRSFAAHNLPIQFRPQDVELMLDQAADLLDRILKDRTEYYAVSEKLFEIDSLLALEIAKYESKVNCTLPTDKVAQVQATPVKELGWRGSDEAQHASSDQLTHLSTIIGDTTELIAELNDRGTQAGIAGEFAIVGRPATEQEKTTLRSDAQRSRMYDLNLQATSAASEHEGALANFKRELHTARSAAYKAAEDKAVAELQHELRLKKRDTAKLEGDALNYSERGNVLKIRMANDFNAARDRVTAAKQGLEEIFDYKAETDPDTGPFNPNKGFGIYDNYLVWVRNAISYVVGLTRNDQEFMIAVSLKSIGEASWDQNVTSGEWSFSIKSTPFRSIADAHGGELLVQFPPEYSLVRLRGVALSVIPTTEAAATVANEVWTGTIEAVQGNRVFTCYAGRIQPRTALKDPDILGATLLNNVNPFTLPQSTVVWTVKISPTSIRAFPLGKAAADVFLEMRVVAQVKPA